MVACSRLAVVLHPLYSSKATEFIMQIRSYEHICQPGSDDVGLCALSQYALCAVSAAACAVRASSLHFYGYALAA